MKIKNMKPRTTTKPSKPALQVGGQRFSVSGNTNSSCSKYYQQGFFSVTSGETKYITSKQFKRLLGKPQELECVFVLRPVTEKEQTQSEKPLTEVNDYNGLPVYSVLDHHRAVFKKKLPQQLPPKTHEVHEMEVDTKQPIFRQQ
ncbi:unnamed protein product [Phytophthora fragariaefolia]|uniref:Unnamed protein product n=1 Tax=Phytophthora fragariaefolia TaxID=1490495 RepID=A0A9W6YGQ7_9STRA|nr:unnamed protein product [Phytophthora fragariaefolia]